jgi:dipeptidyl aminopeptidase/acylaminoacyl peptidase
MCGAVPAQAQSVEAKQFGARQGVQQVSLAPDGAHVAIIVPMPGGGEGLLVGTVDGTGALKPVVKSSGHPDHLRYCAWSTPKRLVCTISVIQTDTSGTMMALSRMIAVDSDGSNMKELSARQSLTALGFAQFGGGVLDWLPDEASGAVLFQRTYVPEQGTGTLVAQAKEGLGVERVDTVSLKRSNVETPRKAVSSFITDGHGTVRIMVLEPALNSGYTGSRIVSLYRLAGDRDWKPLATAVADSQTVSGFVPVAMDRDLNLAYGFDVEDGHQALFSVALDGTLKRTLVYKRDGVDVDDLIRIGRQQRVVGVTFAAEKRDTAFFDPKLKALAGSLSRAIPGLPLVSFVDASLDETKLLLFAGSDVDPGRYFLLDRTSKKLSEVLPIRPELASVTLSPVKPVTFPAADGTPVPAYLTLPPGSDGKGLPAIVMPHGGPSARDEWGFDWLAQFFAARGYAVLQPNYRGSSGLGDAWFQENGFRSWRTAIGDINDGGRWLEKQGIAAPGKLAIFGWSYGGYAALQSPALDPDLFKAIVAVAPVTDLETLRGEHERFMDYKRVDAFIGRGPHVREGSPAENVAGIKAPVLLFHGDRDLNVGVGESRMMASRLKGAGKQVEYVEFEGLDHQLDDSAARTKLLDRSDGFIRAALGLPPKP